MSDTPAKHVTLKLTISPELARPTRADVRSQLAMKRSAIVLSVAALVAACAGVPLPKESLSAPGALLFNGYANPNVNCYHCHGGDGTGTLWGKNLAKRIPEIGDGDIVAAIQNGKSFMPSFKGKISDEGQATLVAWLRSTYGGAAK